MATYISSYGERTMIVPQCPPFFSTHELETFVEGKIACMILSDGSMLIYNDIYYEIGVEKNEEATRLAQDCILEDTWIAGPAVHLLQQDCALPMKREREGQ